MAKKVWVHGPISLDTVVYLSEFPNPGSFMNAIRTEQRTGGTAANVALGLCTASVETGFISYLGKDEIGKQLLNVLEQSHIRDLMITYIGDKSNHALVLVDGKSERTIIAMATPHLRELRMDDVAVQPGEIVAFILWREEFLNDLHRAQSAGCYTVVGAGALSDPAIEHADLLIGSRNDFPSELHPEEHLDRFTTIVLTDGINGAILYNGDTKINQPTFRVDVKDTTGAGDAFIAGFLAGIAHELNPNQSLEIAAQWAASSVQFNSSIPPAFEVVKGQWGIDLIP